MPQPRRVPTWALIAGVAVFGLAVFALERADVFPGWRLAARWSPVALPATQVVPPEGIASGLPIVALALDQDALWGPTGILENKLRHGREWEREGSVAYYDGGRLLFASGVGVRVHGGGSRHTSPRQGFRLYFRRAYGPRELAPGLLFSPAAQPLRRLVVHNDVRRDSDKTQWSFVNPLSYDIARAMGAIAPETKPVRFYLNDEYYGPFVLTERFDQRYFAAHWGYDDIHLSQEAFDTLWAWVQRTRPLTMEQVGEQVDLENLTRWFLAVAFCATRDAYQGPGQFLDLTRSSAGWFWVNWDMDQGLRNWDLDSYQYLLERISEGRRGRNRAEPRAVLVTHLLSQDPEYRAYFKRLFLQVMNHLVTTAFLEERYQYYEDVAAQLEVADTSYQRRLREFIDRRPAFFRLITEQWLNAPPSQPVTLVAPEGVTLAIDGESVRSGFEGLYFPDLDLVVEVQAEHRGEVTGWLINGRRVAASPRLSFRAEGPTRVEVLIGDVPASVNASPAPAPSPAVPPTAGTSSAWRRIPAGTFWMGCVPGDSNCDRTELPRIRVRVPEAFEMMAHEVSAGAFLAYSDATSRQMPRQPEWYADLTHPVVNVTWDEAQLYCQWQGGRLPTEEEWEYAARGGLDGRLYPWGDTAPVQPARRGSTIFRRTAPAGTFEANGYGLHDMAGNVWEWTVNLHRPTHATDPSQGAYELRTIKGGSWDSSPPRRRVSERAALARHGRHNLYVGFRCVRPVGS